MPRPGRLQSSCPGFIKRIDGFVGKVGELELQEHEAERVAERACRHQRENAALGSIRHTEPVLLT